MSKLRPPMTEEDKLFYRARLTGKLWKSVRRLFLKREKEQGLTQKELARRLGADPGRVSKLLRGDANVTVNTLCDMARAMDARVEVEVRPLEEIALIAKGATHTTGWRWFSLPKEARLGDGWGVMEQISGPILSTHRVLAWNAVPRNPEWKAYDGDAGKVH